MCFCKDLQVVRENFEASAGSGVSVGKSFNDFAAANDLQMGDKRIDSRYCFCFNFLSTVFRNVLPVEYFHNTVVTDIYHP